MQFIAETVGFILGAYLAFTNILADQIQNVIGPTPSSKVVVTTMSDNPQLTRLESDYSESSSIPSILLQNTGYQQATVIGTRTSGTKNQSDPIDALVNIFCTYQTETATRATTGSGFFINDDGVIMTNAHVAQFLLLKEIDPTGETKCVIRTGNPAIAKYEAQLLYISPAWIQKYAAQIVEKQPRGTGERDYALLYVTKGVGNDPLPARIPFLSLNLAPLTTGSINTGITVAGYPVGTFSSTTINRLTPVRAETTITDLFTFDSQLADVLAIAPSAVGAFGASGGPVVNASGEVIGLISTKGSDSDGETSLRGLTVSYIDRSMKAESGFSIEDTSTGELAFRARLFTTTIAPFLGRILNAEMSE